MTTIDPIYIGSDAISKLVEYADQKQLRRFTIVCDDNTYRALGQRVQQALTEHGLAVNVVRLTGAEVIADEHYLVQVLVEAPLDDRTYIAVGSGTLTDITRFVSHRTGKAFISMPTAPSVDGFTSIGAPIVISGVKQTILCQAPVALFADLDTLRNAPHKLIAAGFGDMIGKITSLADWKIGHIVWDEPFDEAIFKRSQAAIASCIKHAPEIGQNSREGVRQLMDALIESGLCMLDFGNSRPASGAEHHASHYWEMKLLQEHRPAILHGAKVGFALTLVAEQYAKLRALSRQQMLDRLEAATLPDREQEIATIRQGYGVLADDVIREHAPFLDLTEAGFERVKKRIAECWDEIQAVAAMVPAPQEIVGYLRQAGAATDGQSLGLGADEIPLGMQYGHYLRNRFTVMKLSRVLNIPLT
jgi:glycerol-1-phosphate dehydrogenase [NAD(P)+]